MTGPKSFRDLSSERYSQIVSRLPDSALAPSAMRQYLQPWEYHYLIASMHEGMMQNGGDLYGTCCAYYYLDDVIAAWDAIGAPKMAESLRLIRAKSDSLCDMASQKGGRPDDVLSDENYQVLTDYVSSLPVENWKEVERCFSNYWENNQKQNRPSPI